MTGRPGEYLIIAGGLCYLVVLGWAIESTAYDIWGALIVAPIYGVIGVVGLRRMFTVQHANVATVMQWGLLIKAGGALARYWVGFEAYGGGIDAAAYHDAGSIAAGRVWSGEADPLSVIPTHTGTAFVEDFTGLSHALTGGSQLAGFLTFSFLAYWGLALIVKAAIVAIPAMASRKYAVLCVISPSVFYWPSSIGKEALMMLGLGAATYGIALLLNRQRWWAAMLLGTLGLAFASVIRPHMGGIWVAAALPAIFLGVVLTVTQRQQSGDGVRRTTTGRLGLVVVLVLAVAGLWIISSATIRFLEPSTTSAGAEDGGPSLTAIFEETTRRSAQAGSSFTPPSISGPYDWPLASLRTLTRPLPNEAQGIAQLFSAAEMAALFALYLLSWRRVRNLPYMLLTNPYVAFVAGAMFLTGLAYSVFANLGVLTRQKSLIVPFMLLAPCLALPRRRDDATQRQQSAATDPDTDPTRHNALPTSGTPRPNRYSGATQTVSSTVAADIDEFWG